MLRTTCLVLVGMLGLPFWAGAVELNYTWKKGEAHRFNYQDETQFSMGMGAMGNVSASLKVDSDFSLKVLSVRPSGVADVELTVEKLDLYQEGKKIAALKQIPPAARKVKAEVDRKGRAKFFKMVTVYLHDDQVYVGIHKAEAGPRGLSASAEAGGPEGSVSVDLVASVDPKTGKLTASAKVTERPPALKKVKIKQEDPTVDVLPKSIFEMMVLPEGSLEVGQEQEVKLPFVTMKVNLEEYEANVATLKLNSKVQDTTAKEKEADAPSDEEAMPEAKEPTGMEGMPDMGGMMGGQMGMPGGDFPGMKQAGAGLKINVDLTTRFDTKAGKLMGLTGTLANEMSLGGMGGVKSDSKINLRRL